MRTIRKRLNVGLCVAAVVVMGLTLVASPSGAQPLADHVPGDAAIYVGWAGSEQLPETYGQSHLKAILDQSNLRELLNDFLPRVMARIGKEDREAAEVTELLSALLSAVGHHSTAVYVEGIDWTNPDEPMVRMGVLCDAGAQGAELAAKLRRAMTQAPKDVPVKVEEANGLVSVLVGPGGAATKADNSLAASKTFIEAMGHVQKSPVVAAYVDGVRLLAEADQAVEHSSEPDAHKNWPAVKEAMGLSGFHYLVWGSGFEGRDWASQAFISAPAPRKGLLAFLDSEPLSADFFKSIPQTTTVFAAWRLDLAKALEQCRTIAGDIDPEARQQMDDGLNQINKMIGLDVEKDLFAALGSEWGYYIDPAVSGSGIIGVTVINRPRDAAKVEASLSQLERWANDIIRHQIDSPNLTVRFEQAKVDGLTVHYLATPMVAPAWTIANGNLYVALYPRVAASAALAGAESQKAGGKSILDNAVFVALQKQLGDHKASCLSFVDLQKRAPETYGAWMVLTRTVGFGDLFGIRSPAVILPSLKALLAELTPAGGVGWSDDAGWHGRGVQPFPGSGMFASDPLAISQLLQPMMVGIALPSLSRSRQMANRVKSASNLRQIGQGCLLYANENRGKYPPSLGAMAGEVDVGWEVFLMPQSNKTVPPAPRGGDPKALAAWVDANSDYAYLGKGKTNDMAPEEVVAYEKHEPGVEGANVLFGDGHVEWVPASGLSQILIHPAAGAP